MVSYCMFSVQFVNIAFSFADNIAPGKVWVLEVFLTGEEDSLVKDALKNHSGFKTAYSSLDKSAHLTMSSITQIVQSSETTMMKSRGKWRRLTNKSTVGTSHTDGCESPDSVRQQKPSPIQAGVNLTSTPLSNEGKRCSSSHFEDAVVISPNMSTVFFDKSSPEVQPRHSSSSSTRQDGDESEFVDAVETMDTVLVASKGVFVWSVCECVCERE